MPAVALLTVEAGVRMLPDGFRFLRTPDSLGGGAFEDEFAKALQFPSVTAVQQFVSVFLSLHADAIADVRTDCIPNSPRGVHMVWSGHADPRAP